jgi:hypothetical protein
VGAQIGARTVARIHTRTPTPTRIHAHAHACAYTPAPRAAPGRARAPPPPRPPGWCRPPGPAPGGLERHAHTYTRTHAHACRATHTHMNTLTHTRGCLTVQLRAALEAWPHHRHPPHGPALTSSPSSNRHGPTAHSSTQHRQLSRTIRSHAHLQRQQHAREVAPGARPRVRGGRGSRGPALRQLRKALPSRGPGGAAHGAQQRALDGTVGALERAGRGGRWLGRVRPPSLSASLPPNTHRSAA